MRRCKKMKGNRDNLEKINENRGNLMKIAICDDEKEITRHLAEKIRILYPEAEIAVYASGSELLSADEPLDILFLDIQMNGKNGMETARELRRRGRETIIIFVTVVEEYVFEAFDVGAFNYLVKPFDDSRFIKVLKGAVEKYCERGTVAVEAAEEQQIPYAKDILVKKGGTHIKIKADDIIYAEVFNRKILIHKTDGDIEYYGKMSELEGLLSETAHGDFFRTHRAYLINLKYVKKYNVTTVWLEKGTALIAKKNYPQLVKAYLKYNQRCNAERG